MKHYGNSTLEHSCIAKYVSSGNYSAEFFIQLKNKSIYQIKTMFKGKHRKRKSSQSFQAIQKLLERCAENLIRTNRRHLCPMVLA